MWTTARATRTPANRCSGPARVLALLLLLFSVASSLSDTG